MTKKHVKLEENTRILLNQVKAIILSKNPKLLNLTDDKTICTALLEYTRGKK